MLQTQTIEFAKKAVTEIWYPQAATHITQGNKFSKKKEWQKAVDSYIKALTTLNQIPLDYMGEDKCHIQQYKTELSRTIACCFTTMGKMAEGGTKWDKAITPYAEAVKYTSDAIKTIIEVMSVSCSDPTLFIVLAANYLQLENDLVVICANIAFITNEIADYLFDFFTKEIQPEFSKTQETDDLVKFAPAINKCEEPFRLCIQAIESIDKQILETADEDTKRLFLECRIVFLKSLAKYIGYFRQLYTQAMQNHPDATILSGLMEKPSNLVEGMAVFYAHINSLSEESPCLPNNGKNTEYLEQIVDACEAIDITVSSTQHDVYLGIFLSQLAKFYCASGQNDKAISSCIKANATLQYIETNDMDKFGKQLRIIYNNINNVLNTLSRGKNASEIEGVNEEFQAIFEKSKIPDTVKSFAASSTADTHIRQRQQQPQRHANQQSTLFRAPRPREDSSRSNPISFKGCKS